MWQNVKSQHSHACVKCVSSHCDCSAGFQTYLLRLALLTLRSLLVLMFPGVVLEHEIAFSLRRCRGTSPRRIVISKPSPFVSFGWRVLSFLFILHWGKSADPLKMITLKQKHLLKSSTFFWNPQFVTVKITFVSQLQLVKKKQEIMRFL